MMPNWERDDECTAAPGVMGWTGCHRYPGCGCGATLHDVKSEEPTYLPTSTSFYYPEMKASNSNWIKLPFIMVKIDRGNRYFFTKEGDKYLMKEYIPYRTVDNEYTVFHRKSIDSLKIGSLSELFIKQKIISD